MVDVRKAQSHSSVIDGTAASASALTRAVAGIEQVLFGRLARPAWCARQRGFLAHTAEMRRWRRRIWRRCFDSAAPAELSIPNHAFANRGSDRLHGAAQLARLASVDATARPNSQS